MNENEIRIINYDEFFVIIFDDIVESRTIKIPHKNAKVEAGIESILITTNGRCIFNHIKNKKTLMQICKIIESEVEKLNKLS